MASSILRATEVVSPARQRSKALRLMVIRANPEKKEEKERIRHALLRATLRLAAAHGFASLGLREVSREAQIAPTSFYRHFADMEELGLAIIDESVGPLLASVSAQVKEHAKGGHEHVSRVTRGTTEALLEATWGDVDLARFFLAERVGGIARFRAAIAIKVDAFAGALAQLLEHETEGLTRARCESAAEAIVAVLLDAAFRAIDLPAEQDDANAQARKRIASHAAQQTEMIATGAKHAHEKEGR